MEEDTHGDLLEGVGDYVQGRNMEKFLILSVIGVFTIGLGQDLSLG